MGPLTIVLVLPAAVVRFAPRVSLEGMEPLFRAPFLLFSWPYALGMLPLSRPFATRGQDFGLDIERRAASFRTRQNITNLIRLLLRVLCLLGERLRHSGKTRRFCLARHTPAQVGPLLECTHGSPECAFDVFHPDA
jgi:hypothetical protein